MCVCVHCIVKRKKNSQENEKKNFLIGFLEMNATRKYLAQTLAVKKKHFVGSSSNIPIMDKSWFVFEVLRLRKKLISTSIKLEAVFTCVTNSERRAVPQSNLHICHLIKTY